VAEEYSTITYRLVEILKRLHSGRCITTKELSIDFDTDVRTIQRDINDRLSKFLPIFKDGKCYRLEKYALGQLSFDDLKIFAKISGIDTLYPKQDDDFLSNLLNKKINNIYLVKNSIKEPYLDDYELFEKLSQAILKHNIVGFYYSNKPRKVKPYKLFNNEGVWYLIADDQGIVKHFSINKIKDWHIFKDKIFTPDDKISQMITDDKTNWFSNEPIEVILHIDKTVQEYFKNRQILPNQQIIKEDETGLQISIKVAYDIELFRVVRAWIPNIHIISPKEWQEKLNDTLREYLDI